MQKKRLGVIAAIVVVMFIAFGFVFAALYKEPEMCTQKYCNCSGDERVECNTCNRYNPIFLSVLVNVGKSCVGKEIIECKDNERERSLELSKNKCSYIWTNVFSSMNRDASGVIIFEDEANVSSLTVNKSL